MPCPAVFPPRVFERVMRKSARDADGHLISAYSVGSHGYPQVGWVEGGLTRMTLCHRVVWTFERGPIDAGMTVDHLCKVRRCIDVDHLRLIPNIENARRTSGRDWPLGQCINGHPDSVFWHKPADGSKAYCKECRRQQRSLAGTKVGPPVPAAIDGRLRSSATLGSP
jgi:hypothetical protein